MKGDPARAGVDPESLDARVVAGLRVEIDRGICVGFGDCLEPAPGAFALDEEDVAVFDDPGSVGREALLAACRACPVDAITVRDEDGELLVP